MITKHSLRNTLRHPSITLRQAQCDIPQDDILSCDSILNNLLSS